jgi:hypothetical protein
MTNVFVAVAIICKLGGCPYSRLLLTRLEFLQPADVRINTLLRNYL